jgi:hypothetical protein
MNLLKRIFNPNGRKPVEHSTDFVPQYQRLPDSIGEEYKTSTMLEIAQRHNVSTQSVSRKLNELGVRERQLMRIKLGITSSTGWDDSVELCKT